MIEKFCWFSAFLSEKAEICETDIKKPREWGFLTGIYLISILCDFGL